MLDIILETNTIYYTIAILFIVGMVLKLVASRKIRYLNIQVKEMNKSTEPFLKLVKAKFEHASMANDGVGNVNVFVDKYLREYKICGLSIHTMDKCRIVVLVGMVLLSLVGAVATYVTNTSVNTPSEYLTLGVISTLVLVGFYQMIDEKYRLNTVRIYMIDYLENVMANRIKKSNRSMEYRMELEPVPEAEVEITEEAYPVVTMGNDMGPEVKESTAGTSLEEVQEVQDLQVKKLEMANLLKIKVEEQDGGMDEKLKGDMERNKTFNILEAMAKRDVVEDTPNEALIREILQEFMA